MPTRTPIPVSRAMRQISANLDLARRQQRIPVALLAERAGLSMPTVTKMLRTGNGSFGVIGQNVCPFWLVFLCGGGRSSCSSCMGGELEVGQNVCPEWPVRPCGTTVE